MYFLYYFGELIGAFILLAVIYLLFSNGRLKKRIVALEERVMGSVGTPTEADRATQTEIETPQPDRRPEQASELPEEADSQVPVIPAATSTTAEVIDSAAPENAPRQDDGLPPKAFVFTPDQVERFSAWAKENWFLLVAALSLAMAGIYLVQYGIEQGLLTPSMRVISAVGFGAALIGAGEWIRRRTGDDDGATAFLPSTLAGAGLVSVFTGVFAARQLYDLIGPTPALLALSMTAVLALILGWFYGPFLIAIGLVGGTAAPFLVGGSSPDPFGLYYYFALIAAIGMGVDAIKRIAWISVLALVLAFGAAFLVHLAGASEVHYVAFGIIMLALTATIPVSSLMPSHSGSMVTEALLAKDGTRIWPDFPTRICATVMIGATCIVMLIENSGSGGLALALAGVIALYVMAALWLSRAAALTDLVAIPALAFLGLIVVTALNFGAIYSDFISWQQVNPEDTPPRTATLITAIALIMSIIATWRARAGAAYPHLWLIGAAVLTPAAIILLDVFWRPYLILGSATWALHAMVAAILMTVLAERSAKNPELGSGPVAGFALGALTMISLALVTMLSMTALTLALAVLTLGAAALDRRFDLRPLSWFVQLGALTTGWRLVIDPGLVFADRAPISEVIFVFGGAISLLVAAWVVLAKRERPAARIVLESVAVTATAIFVCVLIFRWIASMDAATYRDLSHWAIGLYATVWMIASGAQIYRRQIGGMMNFVRTFLAVVFALMGLILILLNLTLTSPLIQALSNDLVLGVPFLSSLIIGYAAPALVLGLSASRLPGLHRWLRHFYFGLAGLLATFYMAMSIRHFWRGPDLSVWGISDPEQYSYTVMMMLASVALIILAYLRRSPILRKLGMIGVALTIAKVYLIDAADLTGLTRFFSFLLLGIVLIGLAWLNKVIKAAEEARDKPLDDPEP